MAQQLIDLGTTAGDKTGTPLRTGGDYINDNFTELYSVGGYAFYEDDGTSSLNITTTPTKLTINQLGVNNYVGHLPIPIRGSGTLLNASSFITPILENDSYDLRLGFNVSSRTSNPKYVTLQLDIGGGASPSIVIYSERIEVDRSAPFLTGTTFPIFCRSTFLTNGGQLFLSTDTGSLTITTRNVFLKRDVSGAI